MSWEDGVEKRYERDAIQLIFKIAQSQCWTKFFNLEQKENIFNKN